MTNKKLLMMNTGVSQGKQKSHDEKSDKRYYGSSKYEEDHIWLYYSEVHRGWMCKICEKYPYSAGPSKGAFSTRSCENTTHPSHSFRQHEISKRHKRLEAAKLYDSSYNHVHK